MNGVKGDRPTEQELGKQLAFLPLSGSVLREVSGWGDQWCGLPSSLARSQRRPFLHSRPRIKQILTLHLRFPS